MERSARPASAAGPPPFARADQSAARAGSGLRTGGRSAAIVGDLDVQPVAGEVEPGLGFGGGVFGDVRQCLLDDAVRGHIGARRQRPRFAAGGDGDLESGRLEGGGQLRHGPDARRGKFQCTHIRRPQATWTHSQVQTDSPPAQKTQRPAGTRSSVSRAAIAVRCKLWQRPACCDPARAPLIAAHVPMCDRSRRALAVIIRFHTPQAGSRSARTPRSGPCVCPEH